MTDRITDERLVDIEGFFTDGYDLELLQALKAEREHSRRLEGLRDFDSEVIAELKIELKKLGFKD
jgi:hypothetical protein